MILQKGSPLVPNSTDVRLKRPFGGYECGFETKKQAEMHER